MLSLFLAFLFLFGMFVLTSFQSALRSCDQRAFKQQMQQFQITFPYASLLHLCAPRSFADALFFSLSTALHIARIGSILFFCLFFLQRGWFSPRPPYFPWPAGVVSLLLLTVLTYAIGEFISRIFGIQKRSLTLHLFSWPVSFFLALAFPLTYPLLKCNQYILASVDLEQYRKPMTKVNQEIMEIIEEANVSLDLDANDQKLIGSVIRFRERIAREIMIPRVNMFALAADTSIRQAATLLDEEGYSRVPVYQESVDEIVGVLMYKDIFEQYMIYRERGNAEEILDKPIQTIVKDVLYTPETKKISHLLQEFRKKQVHLAIVVDEYGTTEGIVTIEDILEEIVGEIEDEYDVDESLFLEMSDGSWLVDGRMSILDIEEKLQIKIPPDGDYDTIGGFVFHKTGMIPPKGYVLTEESFVVEVLRSDDRRVEKVRLTKRKQPFSEIEE